MKVHVCIAVKITLASFVVGAGSICFAQVRSGDLAKDYPNRPVRIIAQFAPGTTTDVVARVVAERLAESWSSPVIVENRPGAGGRVGTEIAAKATPDGYTLTMGISGAFGIAPALYPKLPYDAIRDFAPVTNVTTQAQVLVTGSASPMKTVTDLVRAAQSQPGVMNYGSVGPGTATHLAMEMLQSFGKIRLTHVPFKGSAAAHVDLIGGQIHVMFDGLPASLPHIKSGRLRGIAVSTAQRQSFVPELPTVAEAGYAGFEAVGWAGIVAPAGTPNAILDKLNREIVRIISTQETKARFAAMAINPVGDTREQFGAFIKAEIAKWRGVIKEAGVKVE